MKLLSARIWLIPLLILLLLPAQGETKQHDKVLFVGNSFSFYNNGIHNHLGSLIRASGEWQRGDNRLRMLTLSGGHIHEHLDGLEAYLKNDTRGWQTVILQGHSNEAIAKNKRQRFEESLAQAIQIVRKNELTPILFMTWGYKNTPDMFDELASAYIAQAKKHQIQLVPVGLAFDSINRQHPNIELYVLDVLGRDEVSGDITFRKDIKHPSEAGTYLAACVFYASLYKRTPEGNPFHGGLDASTAKTLQSVSWQIVQAFNSQE